MMKISLILMYLSFLLLCSCSQPIGPQPIRQPATSEMMIPLHVGNTWSYIESATGRRNMPPDPYVITTVPHIVYSYPTAPTGARQCFESETFTDGTNAWIVSYSTIMIGTLNGTEAYITSLLPQYPAANTRYGYARDLLCLGTERITTPAGTFTCFHFKLDGAGRAEYWWALGVGLVQKVAPGTNDEPAERWMLESYHVTKE